MPKGFRYAEFGKYGERVGGRLSGARTDWLAVRKATFYDVIGFGP